MPLSTRPWPVLAACTILLSTPALAQSPVEPEPQPVEAPDTRVEEALEEPAAPESAAPGGAEQSDDAPAANAPDDNIAADDAASSDPASSDPASSDPASSDQSSSTAADPTMVAADGGKLVAVAPPVPARPATLLLRGAEDDRLPWQIVLSGFLRTRYTEIQDDPNFDTVGQHDGFVLSHARIGLDGSLDNGLGFEFQVDASAPIGQVRSDSPVENLAVRATDAYVRYAPHELVRFQLGQFKSPFDAEDLLSTADLLFVNRSVVSRGVADYEGFALPGLSVGRELGLQLSGRSFPMAEGDAVEGFGVSYAAAVTNGTSANRSLNDNDRFAYYGRVGLHWGTYVSLGGAYMFNDDTFGEAPNRIDREVTAWTADLLVNVAGFSLFANLIEQQVSSPDIPNDPELTARGYQVQVAYLEPFIGLQPAYRFANYDPTAEVAGNVDSPVFETDALTYHTFGLNYNARRYPVRVMANYTLALEQEGRDLDNNRFDLLLQLEW